jgi:hypothetical protein
MMPIVLPIHAREGETVEIHWHTQGERLGLFARV